MSDSDSDDAFESADEGDDSLQFTSVQEPAACDSNVALKKPIEAVENKTDVESRNRTEIGASGDCVDQTDVVEEAVQVSGSSDLPIAPVLEEKCDNRSSEVNVLELDSNKGEGDEPSPTTNSNLCVQTESISSFNSSAPCDRSSNSECIKDSLEECESDSLNEVQFRSDDDVSESRNTDCKTKENEDVVEGKSEIGKHVTESSHRDGSKSSDKYASSAIGEFKVDKVDDPEVLDVGNDGWDIGWEIDDADLDIDDDLDKTKRASRSATAEKSIDVQEVLSVKSALDKLTSSTSKSVNDAVSGSSQGKGWASWGGWTSSIVSTAHASVSTFTDHVGQGLGSVLESMESTLGAPSPEDMAKLKLESNQLSEADQGNIGDIHEEDKNSSFKFGTLLSGVSNMLENTGNKVIGSGVGALEIIGKKTMDIITEGDPHLKNKRALISSATGSSHPVLSQLLRQAKEQNEDDKFSNKDDNKCDGRSVTSVADRDKDVTFLNLFDEYHGLVHLEALEMLSDQNNVKLQGRRILRLTDDLRMSLNYIEDVCCDLPDTDSIEGEHVEPFNDVLFECSNIFDVSHRPHKLIDAVEQLWRNYESEQESSAKVLYESAIKAQAMITALAIEQLHKMAELLMLGKSANGFENKADALVRMSLRICAELESIATKYAEKIINIKPSNDKNVNDYTTNIYLEMANSITYVHDAVKLTCPILKMCAVNEIRMSSDNTA
ncbi:Uncharacterised protein g397 [Pycnogonum litorale]